MAAARVGAGANPNLRRGAAPALPAAAQNKLIDKDDAKHIARQNALPAIENSDLRFIRALASGGQKKVGLYHWISRGVDVVKLSLLDHATDLDSAQAEPSLRRAHADFLSEIALLHELSAYRNIMRIYATVRGQLAFIAEYCERGSVSRHLRAANALDNGTSDLHSVEEKYFQINNNL
jgi:hypothetical protein